MEKANSSQIIISKLIKEHKKCPINKKKVFKFRLSKRLSLTSIQTQKSDDDIIFLDQEQSSKKWRTGRLIQMKWLIRRNFILTINHVLGPIETFHNVLISLFIGIVWFQTKWNISNINNIFGFVIKSISLTKYFSSFFHSLKTFLKHILGISITVLFSKNTFWIFCSSWWKTCS